MGLSDEPRSLVDKALVTSIRSIRLIAFDFDGVFTDNGVYVSQDGRESVRCSRSDGFGLSKLRKLGIEMIIISTETNPVVSARADKLQIPCIQGCDDKRGTLEEILAEKDLTPRQAAFMGNDINDLPCLEIVGLPIVVHDAHEDVLSVARYRTEKAGGHGAVREVCDLFARVLGTVPS